jgi:hypothetical protein
MPRSSRRTPTLSRLADHLRPGTGPGRFREGLKLVLDGIHASAKAAAAKGRRLLARCSFGTQCFRTSCDRAQSLARDLKFHALQRTASQLQASTHEFIGWKAPESTAKHLRRSDDERMELAQSLGPRLQGPSRVVSRIRSASREPRCRGCASLSSASASRALGWRQADRTLLASGADVGVVPSRVHVRRRTSV